MSQAFNIELRIQAFERYKRKSGWSLIEYLTLDVIDDYADSIGLKTPHRYPVGSAIWHDRLEAECYFIAGDCI